MTNRRRPASRESSVRRGGFTLTEIIAATAILGIIFSGTTVLRASQINYAKKSQSERDAASIQEALSCYLFFHGDEPESLRDISVEKLFKKGFLLGENKSPWNTPYKLVIQDSSAVVEIEPLFNKKRGW